MAQALGFEFREQHGATERDDQFVDPLLRDVLQRLRGGAWLTEHRWMGIHWGLGPLPFHPHAFPDRQHV